MTVTCLVLGLARRPHYRWLTRPVGTREPTGAYLADAVSDAHLDDPEYGHRLLAEEARDAGQLRADGVADLP